MSSRKNRDGGDRLQPFVPLFRQTLKSPAYRRLAFGARALFTALRMHCVKNNGHVYLSQRDAAEEMGHHHRNDIANWFRELAHFGFIVQTEGASLGVDGKGKAPHWRITDMPTRDGNGKLASATNEFLRWDGVLFEPHVAPSRRWNARKQTAFQNQNPGLHVRTTVDCTSVPEVDCTSVPPDEESGTDVQSISVRQGGTDVQSITRLATGFAGSGLDERGAVAGRTEPGAGKTGRTPRHGTDDGRPLEAMAAEQIENRGRSGSERQASAPHVVSKPTGPLRARAAHVKIASGFSCEQILAPDIPMASADGRGARLGRWPERIPDTTPRRPPNQKAES
jgi:hypothetical protein